MTTTALPKLQFAIQLVGPGQLRLNAEKPVPAVGDHQILARVECVGLCFSDLKLLKQFSAHARKSEVVRGLPADVLAQIPSYVPNDKPTVPGHEVTCRIIAVGPKVQHHKVGERVLVQTDYRDLPTANSNSAFGYNFEGALQEYVLMDERVVIEKGTGERYLIPVPEHLSASAIALVEPWACVEDSYVTLERQAIKPGGRLLVVVEPGHRAEGLEALTAANKPASILNADPSQVAALPNEEFDDILYFGASADTINILNDKLAANGIINIVLGGRRIGRPVSVGIGRIHYGMTRWIGTVGSNAAESYAVIPQTGEFRPNDKINVVGAGGPMGQMHVIRAICAGIPGLKVIGSDMDDARLESLAKKARPLAERLNIELRLVNTQNNPLGEKFSYIALMAPVGALVATAIGQSLPGAIINIFAGIPAPTRHDLDLDTYIANRCFMFGTSGSSIRDMKIVLQKVVSGQLDTNCSVDAVSGMAGAADGIAAVENRTLAGKILVYPQLHELPLTPLSEIGRQYPTVAARLRNGSWTKEAEQELLRVAG